VGDNIYIVWSTNKTGNDEVMFKVSNDAGATFGDKINLSNTTASDSQDAANTAWIVLVQTGVELVFEDL
jgi:hypothetical protein